MSDRVALVFGKEGQIARALADAPWPRGWRLVTAGRERCDLRTGDEIPIAVLLEAERPSVVINAAAYTAVDKAEDEPDLAAAVNARAPGLIAAACAARALPVLHISTDYVFDGEKRTPYTEDDAVRPLSVYGRTKADGETAIRERRADHVILRTSGVFSAHGHNFVKAMLSLARDGRALDVVDDQCCCPTFAGDLARVLVDLATRLAVGPGAPRGTFHYAGAGPITWHGFAQAIFERAGPLGLPRPPALRRTTSPAFAARAPRPKYSVLDCTKIAASYGIERASWQQGLDACLEALSGSGSA